MLSFANVGLLLLKDFTCSLLHTVMWKGMFMFYAAYLLIIFDNQPISFWRNAEQLIRFLPDYRTSIVGNFQYIGR